MLVWALSFSLAATLEIDFSFSSSGYLDVSVHRVPLHTLCIGVWILEVFSSGFPHSDISGSQDICSSPKLFAAYHVFHRLLVPRHPPCALYSITNSHNSLLFTGECYTHIHSVVCVGTGSINSLIRSCFLLQTFALLSLSLILFSMFVFFIRFLELGFYCMDSSFIQFLPLMS